MSKAARMSGRRNVGNPKLTPFHSRNAQKVIRKYKKSEIKHSAINDIPNDYISWGLLIIVATIIIVGTWSNL